MIFSLFIPAWLPSDEVVEVVQEVIFDSRVCLEMGAQPEQLWVDVCRSG